MDQELREKIEEIEEKVNRIYVSVEKTRRYFLWVLIVTIAMIVLPLVALAFILPQFISTLSSAYSF